MTIRMIVWETPNDPAQKVHDIIEVDLTPKGNLPKAFVDHLLLSLRDERTVTITNRPTKPKEIHMNEPTHTINSICICGNMLDEHEPDNGPCRIPGCDCKHFVDADQFDPYPSELTPLELMHSSNCASHSGGPCDCDDEAGD